MLAVPGLFALGVATHYAPLLRADPADSILVPVVASGPVWQKNTNADALFAAWLVGRHARTLATRPLLLLETEHCAPLRQSIALGPPMLTLGALALPAWLVSRDPIASFNAAVFLMPWLGALAVFLLVLDWTRLPAAAAVAGVLYGTSPLVLADVAHPFIRDMAWSAFGLLFARRLFASGRWRYVFGLAACLVAQVGASAYAALAACFLAPPLGLWLFWHYGLRHVRPAQLLVAGLCAGGAVAVVLWPYAELRASSELLQRETQLFAPASAFLPGGFRFPGFLALGLAASAFAVARPRALAGLDGDPRLALLTGLVLVLLAATGPLYVVLAPVLPFAGAVRVVAQLGIGFQLALCVLAGIGAAGLLRALPVRVRPAAGLLAVAAAFLLTVRPFWLGFEPRLDLATLRARPAPEALHFAARLADVGAGGPIAELPVRRIRDEMEVRRILLSSWHGRRTSACFGSYTPREQDRLRRLAAALPAPGAVRELRRLGFTTLVVHGDSPPLAERYERPAASGTAPLPVELRAAGVTAFSLGDSGPRRVVESTSP